MTDKAKRRLVMEAIAEVTPQIFINAGKICTYNSDIWADDLASHILEYFLEQPLEKQYKIAIEDDALENFLTRSMSIQVKSSTSPFYYKYRKATMNIRELYTEYDYDQEDDFDKVLQSEELKIKLAQYVDELDFYDKHLIVEYYYNNTPAKTIGEKLNINSSRIIKDIRAALKRLKIKLQDE